MGSRQGLGLLGTILVGLHGPDLGNLCPREACVVHTERSECLLSVGMKGMGDGLWQVPGSSGQLMGFWSMKRVERV